MEEVEEEKGLEEIIRDIIEECSDAPCSWNNNMRYASLENVYRAARERGVTEEKVKGVIEYLMIQGQAYEPDKDHIGLI